MLVDLLLVTVFAILGRASHAEVLTLEGIAGTAVPFLIAGLLGTALAWLVGRWNWLVSGLVVSAITVVGGLLLRLAFGGTAALPFVIVAALVLTTMLLGWRGTWAAVQHVRSKRTPTGWEDRPGSQPS